MERLLSVVVHDAAAATLPACERLIAAIDEAAAGVAVPLTLLAVPRYHGEAEDAGFDAWLRSRAAAGDEIALHGYTHRDDGTPRGLFDRLRRHVYTRGEGEFSDLAAPEARRRLQAGLAWFAARRLAPQGFVAPAWLMSAGTWDALAGARFAYTCTLGQLVLLPARRPVISQSLVYSNANAWRRAASCVWVSGIAALQRDRPLLRLELHPRDADHPALRRHWQRLLARCLATRQPVTLAEAARRCAPASVRTDRT